MRRFYSSLQKPRGGFVVASRQHPDRITRQYCLYRHHSSSSSSSNPALGGAAGGGGEGRLTAPVNSTTVSQLESNAPVLKEDKSPLVRYFIDLIKMTGPLSVATYMKQALIHPLGGYYMKSDVFGQQGDFTTSPEISQLFGELRTHAGRGGSGENSSKLQLVELGPGRGTLMSDILRTLAQFKDISSRITGVHLVEASPELRKLQAANLKTTSPTRISSLKDLEEQQSQDHINHDPHDADQQLQIVREDGIPITWHQDILDVPTGIQSIFLAHEFFDALPVFKFQYTEVGWREILIDIAEDHVGASSDTSSTPFHFRYVLAPAPTRATIAFIDSNPKFNSEAMKVVGNRVEISPDSQHIVKEVANRIRKDGGMGLVVDYGKDELIKDSLRAIRKHKFVDVLSSPGDNDITCDVDFSALKEECNLVPGIKAHGPITQSLFLQNMGIAMRLKMLLTSTAGSSSYMNSEQRRSLIKGVERLVGGEKAGGMGEIYKFMAIAPLNNDQPPYSF